MSLLRMKQVNENLQVYLLVMYMSAGTCTAIYTCISRVFQLSHNVYDLMHLLLPLLIHYH